MNIVDIIILAILLFGLLSGMYKGMIASGLSLLGFVGAWFGAKALYARVAHFALSNTTFMAVLNQYLEPDGYFTSRSEALMTVRDVVAGGEAAINQASATVAEKFSFLADAFRQNVRTEAFSNLGINTLADYLNQTLWVAVFNVAAFVLTFIVLYLVINMIVNLLDRVIAFPVLRGFDWLIGGIGGLLRATVVVVLVLNLLPMVLSVLSPELANNLIAGSRVYTFASQLDLLGVSRLIRQLIMG